LVGRRLWLNLQQRACEQIRSSAEGCGLEGALKHGWTGRRGAVELLEATQTGAHGLAAVAAHEFGMPVRGKMTFSDAMHPQTNGRAKRRPIGMRAAGVLAS
jgi:hypothetical protein